MASNIQLIKAQLSELRRQYPYLYLQENEDFPKITGTIFFQKDDIKDHYEVEIYLSKEYPKKIPTVKEIASKIDLSFHHNPDESLCLETPLNVYEIFRENESLMNFTENLLVPYLYTYSFYLKNNRLPYGDHKHGAEGIFENYKTRFKVNEASLVVGLLKVLAEKSYRGHSSCPCGSNKKLRDCHGQYLLRLLKINFNFMKDYLEILAWLKKNWNFDMEPFISRNTRKIIKEIIANPSLKWTY